MNNHITTDDVILRARSLTKTFVMGQASLDVLKGASLAIRTGEFVAITGTSGSGKSTLLHILGALDAPTSGTVIFRDGNVFELPERSRDHLRCRCFGFVYQFYHLLPELTVLENALFPQLIRYSAVQWMTHRHRARQACLQVLERVGLSARLKHKPHELSGGERQRVAIARALANDPSILLADEPTGNLDKRTGAGVLQLLTQLHQQGQTIVMVTHDPQVAGAADRTLRLEDGRLSSAGSPAA